MSSPLAPSACFLGLALLASAGTVAAIEPPARPPSFGVSVANVNVDVLVTRGGRPVEGLTAADFVLVDNGVEQPIEIVEHSATAVDAVLVLDVSTSVRGERLDALRRAAHAFVDALWPTDSVSVLAFGTDLRLVAGAGAPRSAVHAALDRLEGGGATSLVDAVASSLLLTDARRGRPLVVVFSDGVDRGSWLTAEAVLALAKAEDVVLHYVEVEGARTTLDALARATGGRGWSAQRWAGLSAAFVEALDEFRSRYRLRYEPQGVAREGWHSLSVRVRKGGKVRARPGYLVPGEADDR
jgi:VWFA-related protein